uniref:hypothetical protein n=1 Tax=Candidatus Electronema sp. TaxID=2698783 RepID=UPI0040566059
MAWQPLFSVTVEHDFFSSPHKLCLFFSPDQKTEKLLRNANLLLRVSQNSIVVCFNSNDLDILESFRTSDENGLEFTFDVSTADSQFTCYTDLTQNNITPLYRNIHIAEEEVLASQGKIPLKETGAVSDKNIFIGGKLAIFRIIVSSEKKDIVQCKQYFIRFKSRETYWKYFFLGKVVGKEIEIIDLHGKVQFHCAGKQWLLPDVPATVFYADKRIPLRDWPEQHLQLRQKGSSGNKVLIKHLQNASTENLSKEMINGKEEYISAVYVNY